ncbi:MAG: hypothetical protein CMH56_04860 [Myxococcales bacterium]|nr:hypothetical protein [Myxococcales bacterium]|tara:strand:- start:802 stop:2232 length:1431 start_codon:yes stop_codon:yes gene_type:complete
MKKLSFIIAAGLLCAPSLYAETTPKASKPAKAAPEKSKKQETASLARAYKREFAFLESEKRALLKRLKKIETQHEDNRNGLEDKIALLKAKLLSFSAKSTTQNNRLFKLEDRLSSTEAAADNLQSIVEQAQEEGLLAKDPENQEALSEQLAKTFTNGIAKAKASATTVKTQGHFFLTSGEKVAGTLMHIGKTISFGVSEKESGFITPLDADNYRVMKISPEAQKLQNHAASTASLTGFVYEPTEKGIAPKKEKTLEEFLAAGGIIGYVIIGLGLFALLIALLRTFNLRRLGSKRNDSDATVWDAISNQDWDKANQELQHLSGSKSRLLHEGIALLREGRAEIMDKLEEIYLSEEGKIDRMGAMILVFAAVAPLMGLLGTVTGMISTFDIITEFGTGDPKLLSSGISEALVTTELGLIVAIPSLLLGNMLNGWADNIKGELESLILRIQNVATENTPGPTHAIKKAPETVPPVLKVG